MPRPLLLLPILLLIAAPLRAQEGAARSDTVPGPEFDDKVITQAFGLRELDDAIVARVRRDMRCGHTEDAILCNLSMPEGPWEDCARAAITGQFIMIFEAPQGWPKGAVYLGVDCGEASVTGSSHTAAGASTIRFTLETRPGAAGPGDRHDVHVRLGAKGS
jgi:hypothetical protein